MDIIRVHSTNLTFKFTHDLQGADELRKAVQHARARLMQDAMRLNYNVLLSEGYASSAWPTCHSTNVVVTDGIVRSFAKAVDTASKSCTAADPRMQLAR